MAKNFIGGTRKLKWKNLDLLARSFALAQEVKPELALDLASSPYNEFLEKIENSYAIILVSLGDVSPNLVLDALRLGKPVILTKETGLGKRLGDAVIWVDPQNEQEIKERILWLTDDENYKQACRRVAELNLKHSWSEIAQEFLSLARNL